jgi:hypothetical protein
VEDANLDKIMSRITKMLRLAADPGAAEGEKENALRMAHKLISKYNLDINRLSDNNGRTYAPDGRFHHCMMLYNKEWAFGIAQACARLNFCELLIRRMWDAQRNDWAIKREYIFIGSEANARTSGLFAEEFVGATYREYSKRKSQGRTYARSFATGVWHALHMRVQALIKEDTADPQMSVVRQIEGDANNEHITANVPISKKKQRQGANVGLDGFLEGIKHGNTLNLNRRIV